MQRTLRAVLGALTASMVTGTAGAASIPLQQPSRADTGRQLMVYEQKQSVATIRADGSDQELLAGEGRFAEQAAWSPDGSLVAYVSRPYDSEESEVHIVNTRGTGDRFVMEGGTDVDWSPEGDRLVVAVRGQGLFTVRTDGTVQRQLTTAPVLDDLSGETQRALPQNVQWSPAGDRIAFTRRDPLAGRSAADLLLVDPDGSNLQQVTDSDGHQVDGLDWSPDGSRLAFHRVRLGEPAPEPTDVYTVDVNGSGLQRLTHTDEAFSPAWSPDGSTLALSVGNWQEFDRDLFLVDGDGTDLRRLASHASDVRHPDWSPDGEVVAFTGRTCCLSGEYRPRTGTDLYAVDADGTDPRRLTEDTFSQEPIFAPNQPVAFEITERAAGEYRYGTAAAISRTVYDDAEAVVITRGDDYADALAAAPLAGRADAPVLLSRPGHLPKPTLDEVVRLSPNKAYMLGGREALAEQVNEQLRQAGVEEVVRLAGQNRFDTARLVAERLDSDQAYVIEGVHPHPSRGWPDAVAVSALAAHEQAPILLAHHDHLPTETEAALGQLDPETATVIGGPAAVSQDVADELRGDGAAVNRLAGEDRYATSHAVAQASLSAGLDGRRTWLATGQAFPDALAGGPAAAADSGVLLLTHGQDLNHSPTVMDWIDERAGTFERVMLLGGPAAIDETTQRALERAAR